MPKFGPPLEKIYQVMQEKRITYREACAELGRRASAARANKKRRRDWHKGIIKRLGIE